MSRVCSSTTPKLDWLTIVLDMFVQAARETGALQEAKTKLEKRCEELTWRLQLEKRMRVCLLSRHWLRIGSSVYVGRLIILV